MEAPLAFLTLHRMIIVPTGESQQIRRLTLAFGDEGEAAHLHRPVLLREILRLGDMVLAAGKARCVAIMFGDPTDAVMAFPDVGILEHLLDHPRIGRKAGDQCLDVAGVESPAVSGDEILKAEPVLDA
jgi:hypothetical protein